MATMHWEEHGIIYVVFLAKEKPEPNCDETSDKLKWKNTLRNNSL